MRILGVALLALLTAGCSVDPQAAAARRAVLIEQTILNPADRDGVFLVFPLESGGSIGGLEFVWEPAKISEAKATQIVSEICRNGGRSGTLAISKDLGTRSATTANGSQIVVRDVWYDCVR